MLTESFERENASSSPATADKGGEEESEKHGGNRGRDQRAAGAYKRYQWPAERRSQRHDAACCGTPDDRPRGQVAIGEFVLQQRVRGRRVWGIDQPSKGNAEEHDGQTIGRSDDDERDAPRCNDRERESPDVRDRARPCSEPTHES